MNLALKVMRKRMKLQVLASEEIAIGTEYLREH